MPTFERLRSVLRRRFIHAFVLSAVCSGCVGGTETGNPSVTRRLSYSGYSSSAELGVGTQREPVAATIDHAWLSLSAVTFLRGACSPAELPDIEVPALGVGDHATGKHNYSTFDAEGTVCSVRLAFTTVTATDEIGAAPAALLNHSVLLEGRLEDGTPFRISSPHAPLISFALPNAGRDLLDDAEFLIVFDFATWLSGIDLASAERSEDVIEISEVSNVELLDTIQENVPRGIALYLDHDGDGRIDAGSEPLARGTNETD